MYSPDGFASLACLLHGECFFLGYQQPFVWLMNFFHGNYIAFFVLQALTWFGLIFAVYLLAKELKVKHLFLTPFLLLFGCSLFVDNYVGGFENDYIAIVFLLIAIILYLRKEIWIWSFNFVAIGTLFWFWFGYVRLPVLWSIVAEEMWWVHIGAWGLLLGIFLFALIIAGKRLFKSKDNEFIICLIFLVGFIFPKLWFLCIPLMLVTIDFLLKRFYEPKNMLWLMQIIIFALLLGQVLRVGFYTYESWNYPTNTKCYLVNHEYLARVKGISLNYNQASIYEYNTCLKNEGRT